MEGLGIIRSQPHGCLSGCSICKQGCTICHPCDPLRHGGKAIGYPTDKPIEPRQPVKCDICGSTAIDHTEFQCATNRQFAQFRTKESEQ